MKPTIRAFACAAGLILASLQLSSCAEPSSAQPTEQKLSFTDIAYIYHGAPVDRQFKVIDLDRQLIDDILDSMIATLSVGRPAVELPNGQTKAARPAALEAPQAKSMQTFLTGTKADPLLSKIALVRAAIRSLPAAEARTYSERLDVLRQATFRLPDVVKPAAGSKMFSTLAETFAIEGETPPNAANYVADCKAAGVPIPPNWPNAAWIDRGVLPTDFTFAQFPNTVTSSVFTYQAADGSGICYALPRKSASGSVEAMGVICQAKSTGKACFFDNIDGAGNRITGQTIAVDFDKVRNGYSLVENCTECHRGGNAFMIHPKTPLGAIRDRDPDVRYSPIGQSNWSNPPAMAEIDSGECASCHEIAAPNALYCSFLKRAAEKTMPSPTGVAGWTNPIPAYKAHIDFIKSQCGGMP